MLTLPRSNPLYEHIDVQKINLPEAIKKMGAGGFTGYLGYASSSSEGYFIFIKGTLISILMLEGGLRKTGFEAVVSLFGTTLEKGGVINVYRMTVDLAACTHALLHGTEVIKPEPVRSLDLKATLGRMKQQALDGTILFSTPERSAMIFYKAGSPIGFYHDAAHEIETSPAESQRIAALPGAVVEIKSTPPVEELLLHNFLETLNIDRLWQASLSRHAASPSKAPQPSPTQSVPTAANDARLAELVDDLQEIAKAYLGRQGAELVLQLLNNAGGTSVLTDNGMVDTLLSAIAQQAPAIDPEAKIEEMSDLMRSEIAGRLSV